MLPIEELADQGFRLGNVAVGFHIHGAHRLEPALSDLLLQLLKEFRIILFQRLIGVGLRMRIAEFRIAVHQAHLDENRACILVHRVDSAPVIGNIQVRMPDQGDVSAALEIRIVINDALDIVCRLINAFPGIKIDRIQRMGEFFIQEMAVILIEILTARDVHEQDIVIDQGLQVFTDGHQIRAFKNLTAAALGQHHRIALVIGLGAVVGLDFNLKIVPLKERIEINALTVRVQAARILSVHLYDHLSGGGEMQVQLLSLHALRDPDMATDKGRAVGRKVQVALFQGTVVRIVKDILVF